MNRAATALASPPRRTTSAPTTDLYGLLAILARRWLTIAIITSLALAATILYLTVVPPTYVASASIYFDPRPKKIVSDEPQPLSGTGTDLALVESQVAIIRSDAVIGRAIETLRLTEDPEFVFEPRGLTVKLKALFGVKTPSPAPAVQAAEELSRRINVKRAQKSYIIDVEAISASPVKAARLAQAVVDAYLADQAAAKSDDAQRANAMIEGRLGQLRDQVRKAETSLDEFRQSNKIVSSEGGTVGEQQLTRINSELAVARAAAAEAKARYDEAAAGASSGNADVITDPTRTTLLQRLREQLALVSRREASLASQLLPKHPVLIDIRSQVADIKLQIAGELKRLTANAKADVQVAQSRERELARVLETAKQEVARVNTAQIRQRELEQEVVTSRELLRVFLARSKETEEQQKLTAPDARIVSPPSVPNRPAKPIVSLVLALGLLGGLAAGVAGALIRDQADTRLRSAAEVATRTGLSTLAALPRLGPTVGGQRARSGYGTGGIDGSPFGIIARAIATPKTPLEQTYRRAARTLVNTFDPGGEGAARIVLVAGAADARASSEAAFAIAYAAASAGSRVLLVDAASATTALSDAIVPELPSAAPLALEKPAALEAILARDARTGLAVLPLALADLRRLAPTQIARLHTGLTGLAGSFELTVVDGGGLLADDSALALMPLAARAVLAAEAGTSTAGQIESAERLLADAGGKVAGVVLVASDGGGGRSAA